MTSKKKILLLSTGDVNGAYEAIFRIASFLKEDGHEVALAVKTKTQHESFVYRVPFEQGLIRSTVHRIREKFRRKIKIDPQYIFLDEDESRNYVNVKDILAAIPFVPEMVIAGMTDGFVVTHHLAAIHRLTGARIYTVTVDMSVLTGGCHFAWSCEGYKTDCGNCPAIPDENHKNYPRKNLLIKQRNVREGKINIIAGSGWTLNQARESALFSRQEKIESIPGCIDTEIFNSRNRKTAKAVFNIPENIKLIFCGAQNFNDPRKGFSYFIEALQLLYNSCDTDLRENVRVLVVERGEREKETDHIPFQIQKIDYIRDYRLLSLAYQASDIYVCSSIEDSGPLMVSEALACGTPVVGFEMGAVSDMVVTDYNGYKAILKNSGDLAEGMRKMLNLSAADQEKYSANAVEQVAKYASKEVVTDILGKLF